jgi:hypothetical protein
VADLCVTFCSVDSTVIAQQVARSLHGARCNVLRAIWRWHALLFAKRETKDAAVGANEVVGAVAAVVVFVAFGCVLPVDGHKRNACFIARVSLVDLTETSGNVHKSVGAQQQPDDDDDDDDGGGGGGGAKRSRQGNVHASHVVVVWVMDTSG